MADAHKNFAISAVATAPSPATSGTSLVVTTGHGTRFPTPPFNAVIWPVNTTPDSTNAEIVRVTAISTDTLTITRAQESTSARTVVVGDQIAASITAKTLTDVEFPKLVPASDGFPNLLEGQAAAPSSGVSLFTRNIASRRLPAYMGPSGLDSSLQPFLGRNKIVWAQPVGGVATLNVMGITVSTTGTATPAAMASTNLHTSLSRIDYLVNTAATTAVAGWRGSANQFWFGNAAGLGGFTFVCRWSPATGQSTTTARHFVGMSSNTGAPTDVQPSSLTNMFGVGWDAADTNMQFMSNDGTGTATKIDLGSNFAVPTTDRPGVWELTMFAAPNTSVLNYLVTNVGTGTTASGTVTTDLPSNTTFLSPRGYASVGGTSSVIGTTLFSLYIETDL